MVKLKPLGLGALKVLRPSGCAAASTVPMPKNCIEINFHEYPTDEYTNTTPKILSYVNRNLHLQKRHPLNLVRQAIVDYFYSSYVNVKGSPVFSVFDRLSPVVTVTQNFDSLLTPLKHPSRSKHDCYYINKDTLLRAHTTAHLADMVRSGLDNFIVIGDVYRRDEIDSTHFPVFHQLDAARSQTKDQLFPDRPDLEIFENEYKLNISKMPPFQLKEYNPSDEKVKPPSSCIEYDKQSCHTLEAVKVMEYQLKHALVGMVKRLFGENIEYRWVDAYFPFTQPSWELEVFYNDKWMEVLGSGIVRNEILVQAGSTNTIAYAFGLGLERIAMALYDIPDIRLFWSNDSGFLSQFQSKEPGRIIKYRAISLYPQCINNLSFWLPDGTTIDNFSSNDFYDLVRDIGGDIIEQVQLIDSFVHPKTEKHSLCYKIVYRHMERTLTKEEVNRIQKKIEDAAKETLNVVIR